MRSSTQTNFNSSPFHPRLRQHTSFVYATLCFSMRMWQLSSQARLESASTQDQRPLLGREIRRCQSRAICGTRGVRRLTWAAVSNVQRQRARKDTLLVCSLRSLQRSLRRNSHETSTVLLPHEGWAELEQIELACSCLSRMAPRRSRWLLPNRASFCTCIHSTENDAQ
mmetsp:Transcript_34156/g.80552  ORF Transcript_34156/g.80552 Transcript_34156/m.80552 type:complete len:168 (+) Transcript_34156:361-864(+)